MASEGSNLRWLIGIIVAILAAGGGIAAWKELIDPPATRPPVAPTPLRESPLEITQMWVASGNDYRVVQNGFKDGARYFMDRQYEYEGVPHNLYGSHYIKTANRDLFQTDSPFLRFTVNKDVTVYVAYDERYPRRPDWMSSFVDSGYKVKNSDKGSPGMRLYGRDFSAGLVTLGGNLSQGMSRDNYGMYGVIISEK